MPERVEVRHDPAQRRFSAVVAGVEAMLAYEERGGVLYLTHTGVPPEIGGRGVAGELVRTALDYARAQGLKVVPSCTYAAAYIKRNPQYGDLVAA